MTWRIQDWHSRLFVCNYAILLDQTSLTCWKLLHSTLQVATHYVQSVKACTGNMLLLCCAICVVINFEWCVCTQDINRCLCTFKELPKVLPELCDINSQKLLCAISWATYRSEEFDLIHCCLRVVFRTLHHLHCNKSLHPATKAQVMFTKRKHRTRSYYNSLRVSCYCICYQTWGLKNKTVQ